MDTKQPATQPTTPKEEEQYSIDKETAHKAAGAALCVGLGVIVGLFIG